MIGANEKEERMLDLKKTSITVNGEAITPMETPIEFSPVESESDRDVVDLRLYEEQSLCPLQSNVARISPAGWKYK